MSGLSGQYPLSDLLECAGLARSSYYYALAHPKGPTRPELWDAAAEIFSRTANGCGHRQIAMCLRAERGAVIADKTVLKMMHEMGIRCGIRRETDYHRYNSYKGVVGRTFENVVGRDFEADGPWEKMGTDVTEFRQPWGRRRRTPTWRSSASCSTSSCPRSPRVPDRYCTRTVRMCIAGLRQHAGGRILQAGTASQHPDPHSD